MFSEDEENRTLAPLIKSQLLYHLSYIFIVAGTEGFEPSTRRLTASCSAS